ncbi:hypothetical protein L7F22_038389 [Adiantum nelumboides]|nr:hypothetical protein [Adiantum nelumboides]
MQGLRHASRQALRASVIRESCITTTRACSTDAAPRAVRLSKEERQKLAFQFVDKFKAGNNGQLPSINLLRKEVGGSYDTLKEVIQDFEKGLSDKVANEKTVDLKKSKTKQDSQPVEVATQISNAAKKDGRKKKTSSKEKNVNMEAAAVDDPHDKEEAKEESSSQDRHDKEDVGKESEKDKDGRKIQLLSRKEKEPGQDKKSTPQSLEERHSLKQADAKLTSDDTKKKKKSSVLTEDTLESLMDSLTIDEDRDEDDDSDVAAPEYQQSSTMQIKEGRPQARGGNLKVDSAVNKDDDESSISRLPLRDKDIKVKDMQKGLGAVKSAIQSMAKQPSADLSSGSGTRPPTNVLRIVNLPTHTSANQLRSVCESVAKVHGVSLRRGRIADVHFAVDPREMNIVLDRLRKVAIGNVSNLKVFPALRFSCESSMSGGFGPRDANQFKYVRNGLINAFEQRLKFLCFQVQDFRELHNLKVEK